MLVVGLKALVVGRLPSRPYCWRGASFALIERLGWLLVAGPAGAIRGVGQTGRNSVAEIRRKVEVKSCLAE